MMRDYEALEREGEAWAATKTKADRAEVVQCPNLMCLASDDAGYLVKDGGFACSHCGELVPPHRMEDWLTDLIAHHESELARLYKWRDNVKEAQASR